MSEVRIVRKKRQREAMQWVGDPADFDAFTAWLDGHGIHTMTVYDRELDDHYDLAIHGHRLVTPGTVLVVEDHGPGDATIWYVNPDRFLEEYEDVPGDANESPWDSPEWKDYARHAKQELAPAIKDSYLTMALAPMDGEPDVKFALEIGLSIIMDKPIVLVVRPGVKVPNKLAMVANHIVEGDPSNQEGAARLGESLRQVVAEIQAQRP